MNFSTHSDPLVRELGVQFLFRPSIERFIDRPPEPTNFDKSPYAKNWWDREITRVFETGWTEPTTGTYLNPAYYFNLNYLKYKIENFYENDFGEQPPLYRDNDHYVFDQMYGSLSKRRGKLWIPGHNLVIAKGRRMGWTLNNQGFTMWHFIARLYRNILYFAPDEDTAIKENLELRALCAQIPPIFRRHPKTRKSLELVIENKDKLGQGYYQGKKKIVVNWIDFMPAADPGKPRGNKYGLVQFIEAGRWDNLMDGYNAVIDTVGQGGRQFGSIFIGGTSDMLTNNSEDYKNMWMGSHEARDLPVGETPYKAKAIFLPAYMLRDNAWDFKTGLSDKQKGLEGILKDREAIKNNSRGLLSKKQENPISPEECFIPPTRNEYETIKLDEQYSFVLQNYPESIFLRGYLREETDVYGKLTGNVEFVESVGGDWLVHPDGLPDPTHEGLYVLGIDDFAKDLQAKDVTRKHSKGAIVVYRKHTFKNLGVPCDLPVAIYEKRPSVDAFHEQCLLAMRFWDGLTNYEYNDDRFLNKARTAGLFNKMIYWDDKGMGPSDKPGMNVKEQAVALMTQAQTDYLKQDRHTNIHFARILEAIKKWQTLNDDIASAWHLVLAALEREPKAQQQQQYLQGHGAQTQESCRRQ